MQWADNFFKSLYKSFQTHWTLQMCCYLEDQYSVAYATGKHIWYPKIDIKAYFHYNSSQRGWFSGSFEFLAVVFWHCLREADNYSPTRGVLHTAGEKKPK